MLYWLYYACVYSSSYCDAVGIIFPLLTILLSKMILDRMWEEWSLALVVWLTWTFNIVFLKVTSSNWTVSFLVVSLDRHHLSLVLHSSNLVCFSSILFLMLRFFAIILMLLSEICRRTEQKGNYVQFFRNYIIPNLIMKYSNTNIKILLGFVLWKNKFYLRKWKD